MTTDNRVLETRALNILAVAKALIEQARSLVPDLQDDTTACQLAVQIRQVLEPLRICSECGQASGNVQDVCSGCWPGYQERLRAEDERDGIFVGGVAPEDDEEGDRRWREEHICAECGRGLGPNDGRICVRCLEAQRDEARDRAWEAEEAQEEQRELAEERDWEGEALALEEARRDAEVEPWGE